MSFILDALKKVEQEKRHRTAFTGDDALTYSGKRSRRSRQVLAMLAIALGSALVTATVLRAPSTGEPSRDADVSSVRLAPTEPEPPAEPQPAPEPPPDLQAEPEPTLGSEALTPPGPVPDEEPPDVSESPELVLQGTSVLDGRPVAVISERRVFEGDRIDGAIVIRIGEREVELERDGRKFTLSF